MYFILTLSIFLKIGVILSSHVKSNSISKLERNNVLNKALWVKRNAENNPGLSVFRLNTFDVDEILDNNNDFRNENGQPTMYFSSFNERAKRDTSEVSKDNKRDLSTIKPIKIVDDSYKEAGLLPQTDHYNIIHNIPPHPYTFVVQPKPKYFANMSENFEKIMKPLNYNTQNSSVTVKPKFSFKESNPNDVINKMVLDKNQLPWLQKSLSPSKSPNDTVKSEDESSNITTPNLISQRELFKVIGMLTRTFKRIIKQHNDIKVIHSRLQNLNNNFMRNSEQLIEKFQHFDTKYNNVVRLNEKLNEKLKMIKEQQLNLKNKEETFTKHVLEFEKQRNQFLLQQNLFFNIQKQILAQNEKITYKQAQIANRQTIISHRQSNIAKIFKEAHQTFTTEKVTKSDHNQNINNIQASNADGVKIDLFSVKPDKDLKTLDSDILKTKDEQSIDDLIFKFYFNNTFIDDFIRDQLLGSIVNRPEVRELKIRKPRKGAQSTVLLPVTKEEKIRERRWIKHPKKSRKSETTTVMSIKTKLLRAKNKKNDNSDPFIKMAMNFCTELGQTSNVQTFNWCVEKTLRRLKVIDSKKTATAKPSTVLITTVTTTSAPATTTQTLPKQEDKEESILAKYFPDNDELEEKLKDYDLKPDTEGNVYYDRSLHISDIDVDYGGGVSDVLPGFESDSKVEVSPALDLQALRRTDARRLNDKIKKINMAKK